MNFVSNSNMTSLMTAIATELNENQAMIAVEFSTLQNYEIGDVVRYNDALYRFTSNHTSGAWNSADVESTNVIGLMADVETSPLTTAEVNALIALL